MAKIFGYFSQTVANERGYSLYLDFKGNKVSVTHVFEHPEIAEDELKFIDDANYIGELLKKCSQEMKNYDKMSSKEKMKDYDKMISEEYKNMMKNIMNDTCNEEEKKRQYEVLVHEFFSIMNEIFIFGFSFVDIEKLEQEVEMICDLAKNKNDFESFIESSNIYLTFLYIKERYKALNN